MRTDSDHAGSETFAASAAIRWIGLLGFFAVAAMEAGLLVGLPGWQRAIPVLVTTPIVWLTWTGLRRGARRVTLTPEGITVVPHVGQDVSARWDDVTVRQRWAWGGAEKTLEIFLAGSRYMAHSSHVRDFDDLVAAVLDAVGDDRINRRETNRLDRVLWGGYIPQRAEERRVLTTRQRRRILIAAVVGASLAMGVALLVVVLRTS